MPSTLRAYRRLPLPNPVTSELPVIPQNLVATVSGTYNFPEPNLSLANWYGVKVQRNVTLLHRSKTTIPQPEVR